MIKKLVIGREAFDQIKYYVDKAKFEISGLGNVRVINGIPTVTDIILLKQENDPTETEIDGDAIAKAIYDHHVSGVEGELKFWWHSHVNMGVFWSTTDTDTIKDLTKNGWFVHGVFNKKDEYRLAFSNNDPVEVFIDNLDLEIDENLISAKNKTNYAVIDKLYDEMEQERAKNCDKLFDELVTDKKFQPYVSPYSGNYGTTKPWTGSWNDEVSVGKHQRVTPSENILPISTKMSSGNTTTACELEVEDQLYLDFYNDKRFLYPIGAVELFQYGFTKTQIAYMDSYMNIFELEDIIEYENLIGESIDLELRAEEIV